MNKNKFKQFCVNLSYKTKVMLYFCANNKSLVEISNMKKEQLIDEYGLSDDFIKGDFLLLIDEISTLNDDDYAFLHSYPNGQKITPKRISDRLYKTFKHVDSVVSISDFKDYVRS